MSRKFIVVLLRRGGVTKRMIGTNLIAFIMTTMMMVMGDGVDCDSNDGEDDYDDYDYIDNSDDDYDYNDDSDDDDFDSNDDNDGDCHSIDGIF